MENSNVLITDEAFCNDRRIHLTTNTNSVIPGETSQQIHQAHVPSKFICWLGEGRGPRGGSFATPGVNCRANLLHRD